MSAKKGFKGDKTPQCNAALFIVFILLITAYTPLIGNSQPDEMLEKSSYFKAGDASKSTLIEHWSGPDSFYPNSNQTGVNQTLNSSINIPYNQSVSTAEISMQPLFSSTNSNGTMFGPQSANNWNGTHNGTNGIGHTGMLTLATNSSLGTLTDFEQNVHTPVNWMGNGDNDDIWHILRPTIDSLNTSSNQSVPPSTSQGIGYLSSRALGDLSQNFNSCLSSSVFEVPNYVNNYSLTTKVWLSLLDSDAVWIEAMNDSGIWQVITPDSNYSNSSLLNGSPSMVWSGQSDAWLSQRFQLDSIISSQSNEIKIRFCLQTSSIASARAGVFFDEFRLHNDGDQSGAWLHGSLNGDYAPNANGRLIVPANLSNLSGVLEVELFTNWDIEGGNNDGMTTWLSLDNGTNWFLLSLSPGHPGNGIWYQGTFHQSESTGWVPIRYTLPANVSSHANASNALFRFLVQTDLIVNYGGLSSSGWEGMAIDDIAVYANRSTSSAQKRIITNFTSSSDGLYGNNSGWLNYTGVNENQWNWTNLLGANGPNDIFYHFDVGNLAPAGWSVQTSDTRKFEVGAVSNAAGFGPASWPSGNNGAGIYLANKYTSNMRTHLITPIYDLPENATARLSFKSWVCTEASWDGGAVSLSTDGGDNWWYIPPDMNGFHDQISQVNTLSPFYGEGIFDGSKVNGGCHNVVRGFDLKQSDISNLTGQSVRARFTFFSDTYVELDGWYLDDAGVEIDVYEPQGEWISNLISFDDDFKNGGILDGFVEEKEGTNIRFDILSANGSEILGLQNKTLPLSIDLDRSIHSQFQVRVRMSTNSPLQTPLLKNLNFGSNSYFDVFHLQHQSRGYTISGQSNINYSSGSEIITTGQASISWDINAACPMKNGRLTIVGDNTTISHPGLIVNLQQWEGSPARTIYEMASSTSYRNSTTLSLTMLAGDEITSVQFEPDCLFAPRDTKITLGNSLVIFEASPGQMMFNDILQSVNASSVDNLLDQYFQGGMREVVTIPMTIQTSRGAIKVDFGWVDEPIMEDSISSISASRWVPEQNIKLTTLSWRTESSDPLFDFPTKIDTIKLALSTSPLQSDSFVEVEVVNIQTNPTFRQVKGTGLASLNTAGCQIQVMLNSVEVDWSIDTHWLMDDVDEIHYLVLSTDEEGFEVGPGHLVRSTPFNEFENDLEIIDFNVVSGDSKQLGDAFNPMWPFHLQSNQTLAVSGKVRFEGITNAWAPQDSAEIIIEMKAVPPKNESGGVDEWIGEPVIWSQTWYSPLNQNSLFERELIVPQSFGQFPSGTRFEIRPSISRVGPLSENSSTSIDTTANSIFVPFIVDIEVPKIISIYALDSGGITPADGHVWMSGQSLALRLFIEDSDGLASPLKMYYWLENHDDSNDDGIMQANEYREISVTLNNGLLSTDIDLPLLDDEQIKAPSEMVGRASVYFVGEDLAGNYIANGGSFGEDNDLATIFVANRQDTVVDLDSLEFDTIQGTLLAGKEHHFSFNLTDGNGIQTLDRIELALLGRDDSSNCFITYFPRNMVIEYDQSCIISTPRVIITNHPQSATWNVDFTFRLDWNGSYNSAQSGGIPSLKIFDEGQDLGLGLSKISIFLWQPSYDVEMELINLKDITDPVGVIESNNMWLLRGDEIELFATLMHKGTGLAAEHFPSEAVLNWHLSDGERDSYGVIELGIDGNIHLLLEIDSEIVKHRFATLQLSISETSIAIPQPLVINMTIDESPPLLTVPTGYLTIINSDEMENVDVVVLISDSGGMKYTEITMNWHFRRANQIVMGSHGQAIVSYNSHSGTTTTFSAIVDMALEDQSVLQAFDRIEIWFEVADKAGYELQGYGSSLSPVQPLFRWIDFEPRFDIIQATPYRPTIGEEINITTRVVNEGVLGGEITLLLTDSDGKIYATEIVYLESGQWQQFNWTIEAWKTGRLGLTLQILNQTGQVPIPLANVADNPEQSLSTTSGLLGLSILMVLFSAIGLFMASQKRKRVVDEYEMKRIERLVAIHTSAHSPSSRSVQSRVQAPPRPVDLDENSQEE